MAGRWRTTAFGALVASAVIALAWIAFTPLHSPEAGEKRAQLPAQRLVGQFLVATPQLSDPRFAESVIYIVADDDGGAMGLIVNRVYGRGPLSALLSAFGVEGEGASGTVALYYGGPVMPRSGFILHSGDYSGPETQEIVAGVSLSTGADALRAMGAGEGPRQSRIMLGYAGWGPGQLADEIARGDWLTASAGPALVFDDDAETLWKRIYPHAGKAL
ncbi:MAG: YqgE/AlgH family protein [Rhodospirillales bacterium]|nr:YqgE/AlgH family protein [Rhodospirillales bacterium]